MIILGTVSHETIWGGKKLLPYGDGSKERIGHLYSLCCEKGLETLILNGSFKDRPFQSYFSANKGRFGLAEYQEFPLIIALVEADDNLSIQVHPDDWTAMEEEQAAYGKNESWFFLEPPAKGVIFDGCLTNDKDEIRKRLESNELMPVVDTLSVSAGDYVYVEAGTLHALSSGSLLYEIEENSPWTYRMYDYDRTDADGRKRELHIEKAMKAIKPELKSKAAPMGTEEIEERRYVLKKLEHVTAYQNESSTLECITMIKGRCMADGITIQPGMTVVLEPGEELEGQVELAVMARPK